MGYAAGPQRLPWKCSSVDLPDEHEDLRFPSDGGCFGCSRDNLSGLQLPFRREGDTIVSHYSVDERFHGAPGIAHGGILATIFDEVSCAALVFLRGTHVVTGELTIRYQAPCPVAVAVEFRARVVEETHPRYAVVEGELIADGELLATSRGRFFYVSEEQSAP